MNPNRNVATLFLQDNDLYPERIDIKATVSHLQGEMDQGLMGVQASLEMIPTHLVAEGTLETEKPVTVLDAGGTNLRIARVQFKPDGLPEILNFKKIPMPGSQNEEISADDFFESLAELAEPLLVPGEKIGFCFSYPTEIFPNKDGRLIQWSKEICAPEVVGRTIGVEFQNALRKRGIAEPSEVVLLNDTAATLLSGWALRRERNWGGQVGLILGTGLNACYIEENGAILKLENADPEKRQIINCEIGKYACLKRGEGDELLGKETSNPKTYWAEKMISGGYFGALVSRTMELAAQEGILSNGIVDFLKTKKRFSTKDVDNFCHNPSRKSVLTEAIKQNGTNADAERIWLIVDALLERGARLVASILAATVLKGPTGNGPLNPVCLTIDGTTYYSYYRFQTRVESHLRPFLEERNKYYEMVRVNDAPLIGAAAAALTN